MAALDERTVLEAVLTAAADVFGRSVRATDDFFELGGDSVSAVEIAAAVQDQTGLPVDAVDLLDAAVFSDFAITLAGAQDRS